MALARAFNGRPAVLFADEPTGNLDRQTGDRIADLLFSLNRDFATTLILVTHDEQLAARCDRRLRLREGKLWEEA
ncbi:Lipoprotein-releasing system ATP-binding protein LolD [compost metagenome]